MINQYHKHLEEKKKNSVVRPLSGGINSKIKSESQKSRVSKANHPHNMSMYEKFANLGLGGGSPDRPAVAV